MNGNGWTGHLQSIKTGKLDSQTTGVMATGQEKTVLGWFMRGNGTISSVKTLITSFVKKTERKYRHLHYNGLWCSNMSKFSDGSQRQRTLLSDCITFSPDGKIALITNYWKNWQLVFLTITLLYSRTLELKCSLSTIYWFPECKWTESHGFSQPVTIQLCKSYLPKYGMLQS